MPDKLVNCLSGAFKLYYIPVMPIDRLLRCFLDVVDSTQQKKTKLTEHIKRKQVDSTQQKRASRLTQHSKGKQVDSTQQRKAG